MPPHLHPRSRSTSTLFTTCLTVSFLVVGLPHILPCPVNTRQYSDSGDPSSTPKRRRRKPIDQTSAESVERAGVSQDGEKAGLQSVTARDGAEDIEMDLDSNRRRECPVPKPGGLIGQVMGFREEGKREGAVSVEVQTLRARNWKKEEKVEEG